MFNTIFILLMMVAMILFLCILLIIAISILDEAVAKKLLHKVLSKLGVNID